MEVYTPWKAKEKNIRRSGRLSCIGKGLYPAMVSPFQSSQLGSLCWCLNPVRFNLLASPVLHWEMSSFLAVRLFLQTVLQYTVIVFTSSVLFHLRHLMCAGRWLRFNDCWRGHFEFAAMTLELALFCSFTQGLKQVFINIKAY